jgi:hypothetical protein
MAPRTFHSNERYKNKKRKNDTYEPAKQWDFRMEMQARQKAENYGRERK